MAPTVLVLGGWQEGHARAILHYLLPEVGERRAGYVRLCDKFLIIPAAEAYTAYVDPISRRALKQTDVEYMQVNLLQEGARQKAFARDGKAFDYVFDFSGEADYDADEAVHIERTAKLIPLLGRAAKGVQAYVRCVPPTYGTDGGKTPMTESDGLPWSARGKWTHEGTRALAAIPDLPLVVARPALVYGPYTLGANTSQLLIGEVYRHLGEEMNILWSSGLRLHTVHAHDFAAAMYALAAWRAPLGRAAADKEAAETLPPVPHSGDPLEGFPAKDTTIRAPLFNIVDEGDTTSGKMAELTSKAIGVKTGFYSALVNQLAKTHLDDVAEQANEKHLGPWPEMLASSKPPILCPPFEPRVPTALLGSHEISLDGAKLRRVTSWKPQHPAMTLDVVRETVDCYRKEGLWPNAPPRKNKK